MVGFAFRVPLELHLYFIFCVSRGINSCDLFLPSVSDYLDFIWLCNNGVFSSLHLSRQAKQISDRCWGFCSGDLESWVTTALFNWAWINKQRSSVKQCAITRQHCVVQAPVLDTVLTIFIFKKITTYISSLLSGYYWMSSSSLSPSPPTAWFISLWSHFTQFVCVCIF